MSVHVGEGRPDRSSTPPGLGPPWRPRTGEGGDVPRPYLPGCPWVPRTDPRRWSHHDPTPAGGTSLTQEDPGSTGGGTGRCQDRPGPRWTRPNTDTGLTSCLTVPVSSMPPDSDRGETQGPNRGTSGPSYRTVPVTRPGATCSEDGGPDGRLVMDTLRGEGVVDSGT